MPASGSHLPPIDTLHRVETPEGIDLPLCPAGLVPRALALAIDLLLRGVLLTALALALLPYGDVGLGSLLLLGFVLNTGYMVLFEVLRDGRSPGKQALGLAVVHDDGTAPGWSASLLRNLMRSVDLLPLGYALGILCCLTHPQFKRLGDLAAGTLVVYRPAALQVLRLPDGPAQPAPFALTLAEQQALVALSQRQGQLSPPRVEELASLLAEPLGIAPAQAMARIDSLARAVGNRR